jgi:hypothetical protein
MNTYLINADNSITHSIKSPVTEKSNMVDQIQFICDKTYNGYNMADFDLVMEYVLPISKTHRVITLVLSDSNYKNDFLVYSLPTTELTTAITAESGDVQMSFHFMYTERDYDGNTIERVREIPSVATLKILPLASWFHTSDEALSDLAAMYLENKKTTLALSELANQLNISKADDIRISDGNLELTANGESIGSGVSLEDLNDKLVETGGETGGNVTIVRI